MRLWVKTASRRQGRNFSASWVVSQARAFHPGAVRGAPFEATEASFSFLNIYCLSSMEMESVGNLGWVLCTQSVVGGGWMRVWIATQLNTAAAWGRL